MPTVNCKPTAGGPTATSGADWHIYGGAATAYAAVESQDTYGIRVQDDQATTCTAFSAHDFSGVPTGATINSVSIYWVRKRQGTPTGKTRWNVILSATTTSGTYGKTIDTQQETVARPGGGSWAYADLAGLTVTFQCDGGGSGGATLSYDQYYLVVDYTGGGGLTGFVGYTGTANTAVVEGGTNAWFNGRIKSNTAYPSFSADADTASTGYWKVSVSTDTTFTSPVDSATVSFTIPAGVVTNQSFADYAKVTSLTTGTTYYYRTKVATDTATWVNSEDSYLSFTTLTQTASLAVASMSASCTPDAIAPTYALATATLSTHTNAVQWAFDFGDGYTTSYLGPTGGLVAVTASKTAPHIYTTNSTFTITFTATGVDTTVSSTTTLAVVAPTITCTYSIATTEDSSSNSGPRKVTVTLTDNSSKNNATSTQTRSRDLVDPLEQRLWTITKPGTVTETFTDNPLEVTYGTDTADQGYYGVSLTVTSVYGFSGTTSSTQAFGVGYAPVDATFEAVGPRTGYTPLTVSFLNGSSGQGLSYLWNFGDTSTSTSTATTVTHSYVTSGAYTVTLTATGSTLTGTASDSASRASYVVAIETTGTENAGGLMREIQWHLLEDPNAPPCSTFTVFGGSDEVLACLNRRLKHFCYETEILQTEATLAADTAGVYPLPADLLKLKRVEVAGYNIKPLEQLQADFAQAAWEAATTTGDILGYVVQPEDNLSLRFAPKRTGLTVVVDYVAAPAAVTEPAGCYGWGLLPIPRILAWGVKWGVLADLLNKEGEMNDPVRAKFAEDMYLLAVDLAKMLITRRRQG